MVHGYAHVDVHGVPDVRTVQDSATGAMVNALYMHYRQVTMHGTPDADIKAAYEKFAGGSGHSIRRVSITPV